MNDDLNELKVKPRTARVFSLFLLTRILNKRKQLKTEEDISKKLDYIADMLLEVSYFSTLMIAIDNNDPTLLQKVRKR
jgi:hypothetical protein